MQNKQLLIIGYTWPEPTTTAAGNRMLQLIHFFLKERYHITFSSIASESEQSVDLNALGVQKVPIRLNHSNFDGFVADLNPEIVLFDRFLTEEQFGWRVAEFAPKAIRILDTEDLHSLRHTREKTFQLGVEFTRDLWLQNEITKRELSSIYRSDITLIISSYEMQLLKCIIKKHKRILLHLPFMTAPLGEAQIKAWKTYEQRRDFMCIGNGKHAPNTDAVRWLKKEIWPLIRKQLPEAKLHIYGAYLPEQLQQMHNPKEGFLVQGWAADLKEVFENARINLAPLRFGAGLKGKLLDAIRYGTPSITTRIGAESMQNDSNFNGRIADTAETFAQAAIDLYQNVEKWQKAQANGVQICNTIFDKSKLEEKLRIRIEMVRSNLQGHRTQNIIGQMLFHQTMSSTKYMSKWIEEKNSKS